MNKEIPGYYAVIPSYIRYDNRLNDSEKLLYGEITALTQSTGECWATNSYFANLYDVTTVTISNRIRKLRELGYIEVDMIYKEGTKQIDKRVIKIFNTPLKDNLGTPIKETFNTPIKEIFKENTTSKNTTSINNSIYSQVIEYLNFKTGKGFRLVPGNLTGIKARVNEGYTLEDFKKVIDNKCIEWLDTDMAQYLRPQTLFGTKFDNYLNAKVMPKKSNNAFLDALARGDYD